MYVLLRFFLFKNIENSFYFRFILRNLNRASGCVALFFCIFALKKHNEILHYIVNYVLIFPFSGTTLHHIVIS